MCRPVIAKVLKCERNFIRTLVWCGCEMSVVKGVCCCWWVYFCTRSDGWMVEEEERVL